MNTQTIFRAGNSDVVSISPSLLQDWNYKTGQTVTVSKLDDDRLVIEKIRPVKKAKKTSSFDEWWSEFIKDNAEVLDELAVR